jgi:hypothetical protein
MQQNIILLHDGHQHASAILVVIFSVVRARIQKKIIKMCRNYTTVQYYIVFG